jgi:hypothetical protein
MTVASALIRPAHFFVQLAGTHAAASSFIGARHGLVASNVAVAKAIGQLTGTSLGAAGRNAIAGARDDLHAANWNVSKLYRNRLYRANDIANPHVDLLMDMMDQNNLVNESTQSREMRRMAGPQGYLGGHNYFSRAMAYICTASRQLSCLRGCVLRRDRPSDVKRLRL